MVAQAEVAAAAGAEAGEVATAVGAVGEAAVWAAAGASMGARVGATAVAVEGGGGGGDGGSGGGGSDGSGNGNGGDDGGGGGGGGEPEPTDAAGSRIRTEPCSLPRSLRELPPDIEDGSLSAPIRDALSAREAVGLFWTHMPSAAEKKRASESCLRQRAWEHGIHLAPTWTATKKSPLLG